ncbi:MAG: hypothetical protein ACRDO2_02320 [Nocardioidaceae bacterium]
MRAHTSRLALLAATASLVLVSACSSAEDTASDGEDTTTPAEGTGYTIALPEGWSDVTEEAAENQSLVDLAIAAEPVDSFRTNFNVVKPQPFAGTEDELVEQSAQELESVTNSKVTPVDAVEFDGVRALGQTSTLAAPQGDVTLIQFMVVRDEQIHPVTMTFLAANEDDATAVMEDIIASWQWE